MASEEMVDILDDAGHLTGEVQPRSVAHDEHDLLLHPTINVAVLNPDGTLYVQQRADDLPFGGGMWDPVVAGHVRAGCNPREEAAREVYEELGLKIAPGELIAAFVMKITTINDLGKSTHRGFTNAFLYIGDFTVEDIRLQPEEVQSVEPRHYLEVQRQLQEPGKYPDYMRRPDPHTGLLTAAITFALRAL